MNGHGAAFTCSFCKAIVRNDSRQNHMSTCVHVLEPCRNRCGAYVPRLYHEKHQKTCPNATGSRRSWTSADAERYAQSRKYSESALNLTSVSPPPSYHRVDGSGQLHELSRKVDSLSQLGLSNQKAYYNLSAQTSGLSQGVTLLNNHKAQVERATNALIQDVQFLKKSARDIELLSNKLHEVSSELTTISLNVNSQKLSFKNEQLATRESISELALKVDGISTSLARKLREFSVDADKINEQFVAAREEFEEKIDEQKKRIDNLLFEQRTAKELVVDNAQAIKAVEKELVEVKSNLTQARLEVELTEDRFSNIQGLISTHTGHIIWKITDYEARLEEAKKNDSKYPLKSPIFYSHDYGYRLRLMVYLNGLKKWRGRYLLASLHVLKSDNDALLRWPCKIEANVVLRDCENHDKPSDYLRYITARRDYPNDEPEEPQESSTQYIFIANSTLTKACHLKDGAFFLEVVVKK